MRTLLLAVVLLCSCPALYSQAGFASFHPLRLAPRLSALEAEVHADLFVATTTLTLTFFNPGNDAVESRYSFALVDGQAITGFQLELNDHWRDGSIEERWKARAAYQAVTGQRIDPALLEMTGLNQYSLRIYPFAAQGIRRVRIRVQQLLRHDGEGLRYHFPLSGADTLERIRVSVNVQGVKEPPKAGSGFLETAVFSSAKDGFRLMEDRRGRVPLRSLSFRLPLRDQVTACRWMEDGTERMIAHIRPETGKMEGRSFAGVRLRSGNWVRRIDANLGGWTVEAATTPDDVLELLYWQEEERKPLVRVALQQQPCHLSDPEVLPMLRRFSEVVRNEWWEQLRFGLRYGVVTQRSAYLVLERIQDYITYGIRPPKELEEACAAQGYVWRDRSQLQQGTDRRVALQEAADAYHRRLLWLDPFARQVVAGSLPGSNPVTYKERGSATAKGADMAGETSGGMEEVVVVVGYQNRRHSYQQGVARVWEGNLSFSKAPDLATAISGRVAGLMVAPGNPGSGVEVRLRGASSLNMHRQPLLIVDGLPLPIEELHHLRPADIASVDVVRGDQATLLYGASAANGVLLVTRKGHQRYYRRELAKPYRLADQPDEEYVLTFREAHPSMQMATWRSLQQEAANRRRPTFYVDMAQELYKAGFREEARLALYAAADSTLTYHVPTLRAIAWQLEAWGAAEEALEVHRQILRQQASLQSCFDLGIALWQAGRAQEAVDTLFAALGRQGSGAHTDEAAWKGLMLQLLNVIASDPAHAIDRSRLPEGLLRPAPPGLQLIVQPNAFLENYSYSCSIGVQGPKGWAAVDGFDSVRGTVSPYRLGAGFADFQLVAPPKAGAFRVYLKNFYAYGSGWPYVMRVLSIRRDAQGRVELANQSMVLDNQEGTVEILEWNAGKESTRR